MTSPPERLTLRAVQATVMAALGQGGLTQTQTPKNHPCEGRKSGCLSTRALHVYSKPCDT